MQKYRTLDSLVRARLQKWPQQPPGLDVAKGIWMRARPTDEGGFCQPFLKSPGSDRLRTLPDGLWLCFGGSPVEIFVDILAVEACGSVTNLLDKRSRFAPSTHSMLAVCPLPWLLGQVPEEDPTPRWRKLGVILTEPAAALVVPVRDIRVLYALKPRHYSGFTDSHVAHPHEYFVPMNAITAEDSASNPALQALLARASIRASFLSAA
jgi:hypothetical protein